MSDESDRKQFSVSVSDPVNRVAFDWRTDSRETTVYHLPDPVQVRQAQPPPAQSNPSIQPIRIPQPAQPMEQLEDLGTKTINGLEVSGARSSRTYAAGEIGNDQPITVTHETWISCELPGFVVLQIDDDPRNGVRTTELTDIERGEPDPVLFQVPEGYTVKDHYPDHQN